MRRTAPPVFLALLAACTVTTTGAPCTSDLNCPSDQGCGSNRVCSVEALSCPGHTTAGQCIPGTTCVAGEVVTCTAGSGVCSTRSVQACTDPGMTCTTSGGGVACACPPADACTQLDATRCSPSADAVLRCRPVAAGSACLSWQVEQGCAASGLVCSASACVCPTNPGPTFVADAVGGSPAGAAPHPTGVAAPVGCRYRTLTEALAAANQRGAGSVAVAAGWSAAAPEAVVFSEPGGLSVGPGVTLGTDDATPAVGHYVVTTPAALTGPLVELGPGGAISGFELRNAAASGDGLRTLCPSSADTSPPSITAVRVAAAPGGTPAVRLANGVALVGFCGATLSDVSVDGATTGILVDAVAPGVEVSASAPRITGSTLAGVTVIEGRLTVSGGAVDANAAGVLVGTSGTGAPSFSATGTSFRGNAGDAIFVARGTLATDACPFADNGTHVHVEPTAGAPLLVAVHNSRGSAKMSGASDSAFRVIASGVASSSSISLLGNEVTGNRATQSYMLGTSLRRGGGIVVTFPMPSSIVFEGNVLASNSGDQILVAASAGSLDLRGGSTCESPSNNTLGCYDPGSVGLYSNGALVQIDRNHWTQQPAAPTVDYAGSGVSGASSVCTPSSLICP